MKHRNVRGDDRDRPAIEPSQRNTALGAAVGGRQRGWWGRGGEERAKKIGGKKSHFNETIVSLRAMSVERRQIGRQSASVRGEEGEEGEERRRRRRRRRRAVSA